MGDTYNITWFGGKLGRNVDIYYRFGKKAPTWFVGSVNSIVKFQQDPVSKIIYPATFYRNITVLQTTPNIQNTFWPAFTNSKVKYRNKNKTKQKIKIKYKSYLSSNCDCYSLVFIF